MQKIEKEQIYRSYKYMLAALKKEWSKPKESYKDVIIDKEERTVLTQYIQEFTSNYKDENLDDATSIIKDLERTERACILLRLARKLAFSLRTESAETNQYTLTLDRDEFELFEQIMEGDFYDELFD